MRIRYTEGAKSDLESIYNYYLEKGGRDLSDRFYFNFKKTLLLLKTHSAYGSLKYENIFLGVSTRFIIIKNFPYLMFYIVNESTEEIQVLRIFHEKQNFLELI